MADDNRYVIEMLENRIRTEESAIRANEKSAGIVKGKPQIEVRSAVKIAMYERLIEQERASVIEELARAEQNVVDRQRDIAASKERIAAMQASLYTLHVASYGGIVPGEDCNGAA